MSSNAPRAEKIDSGAPEGSGNAGGEDGPWYGERVLRRQQARERLAESGDRSGGEVSTPAVRNCLVDDEIDEQARVAAATGFPGALDRSGAPGALLGRWGSDAAIVTLARDGRCLDGLDDGFAPGRVLGFGDEADLA
jgi:hypothetical protein